MKQLAEKIHPERWLYLVYYLKQTDYRKLSEFIRFATSKTGHSKITIIKDMLKSSLKYNISLLDYFYFRFFLLFPEERNQWAGTGYLYEYQLRMNPKPFRDLLENKIRFMHFFKEFIHRRYAELTQLKEDKGLLDRLMENASGKLVLKGSHGQVGSEVEVINCSEHNAGSLIAKMRSHKYDLLEEFVIQHPDLMALSPSALNTVRIFTQLSHDNVEFLGARLRISVNSFVDNMAAGNLAAPVDLETGIVNGPGVYSDITRSEQHFHPVTGKSIPGFQVPFWHETLAMVKNAALLCRENKSVGWDIAITSTGPELIEGNHNWCKLLWQLPVKQGLKHMLEKQQEVL